MDSSEEVTIDRGTDAALPDGEIAAHETRNLVILAVHQITVRIAWIFKTESVIIPAFMDTIAGAGWLRGCLPVLNRLGQSVPPLLYSDRLRQAPLKRGPLLATTLLMAVPFLVLSVVWFLAANKRAVWLPAAFLALYAIFFSATGMMQMCFGTLQGKLIRPHRRGLLLGGAGIIGAVLAITCAWFLLKVWLDYDDGGFGYIFGFTGCVFLISGLVCTGIVEPPDAARADGAAIPTGRFRGAWKLIREVPNFRRTLPVALLFVTVQLLFPHFQALGRELLGTQRTDLMVWVVAQNAGNGVFSLILGNLADRFGYRLTLRVAILGAAGAPLLAVLLTFIDAGVARGYFWIAFFLLGMTPVAFRALANYALELSEPDDHPKYLSTLKLVMAIPFLLSPVVGLLVDAVGFPPVFIATAAAMMVSCTLTFRLTEPRHEL